MYCYRVQVLVSLYLSLLTSLTMDVAFVLVLLSPYSPSVVFLVLHLNTLSSPQNLNVLIVLQIFYDQFNTLRDCLLVRLDVDFGTVGCLVGCGDTSELWTVGMI